MKRDYNIHLWKHLFVTAVVAVCPLFYAAAAHAFPPTQCAADRFGGNLNCTAKDVQLTNLSVASGLTSCVGGTTIIVDLNVTVNFGSSSRYDIGIFIAKDGKNPQTLSASGGSASCNVNILPTVSPFQNLDLDACGDGSGGISGGLNIPNVTLLCQAASGSGGKLYIPFVVSWFIQSDPADCSSINEPVPTTTSKCNAPTITQGTVDVVVLPTITKIRQGTTPVIGTPFDYTVTITNTTGDTLTNAVFKDPAVTNLAVNGSPTCSAAGGANCPVTCTKTDMQGAGGCTIPPMPNNSTVTFTINATVTSNPTGSITNTATVTVGSQTATATDTIGGGRVRVIKWREIFR